MKLCTKTGNGICLNCPKLLPNSWGDVCRKDAEILLDCLKTLLSSDLTDEQKQICDEYGIVIKENNLGVMYENN